MTIPLYDYNTARNFIQSGDLIFFNANDIVASTIQTLTKSEWSHVGMVWKIDDVDRIFLLESLNSYGIRLLPLSTRLNGSGKLKKYNGKILLARHSSFSTIANQSNIKKIIDFAMERLGQPYSKIELFDIALRQLFKINKPLLSYNGDKEYICSEYIAKCYKQCDIILSNNEFITPADIINNSNIEKICYID